MTQDSLTFMLLMILVLTAMFFFYRKVYYHFKFLGLHDSKLKDKSILNFVFDPITLLEHFYIIIPIFIKSDRKKEGEELRLESVIVTSAWMFWILFALTLITGLIFNWEQVKR